MRSVKRLALIAPMVLFTTDSVAVAADNGTPTYTTTQAAADAKIREGKHGTSNANAVPQMNRVMRDLEEQRNAPTTTTTEPPAQSESGASRN